MFDLTKPVEFNRKEKSKIVSTDSPKIYGLPVLIIIYVIISGNVFLFLSNILILPLAIIISFVSFLLLIYLTFKILRKYK